MDKGSDTDILTGLPKAETDARKRLEKAAAENRSLQEKAADYGITQSDAGKRVIGIIRDRLIKRIEQLIEEDPAAGHLKSVLADLGIRASQAEAAVDELCNRLLAEQLNS